MCCRLNFLPKGTRRSAKNGSWKIQVSNIGRASNAQLDELVRAVKLEENAAKRTKLMQEALAIEKAEVLHVTLHQQTIPWAMKRGVEAVHRPDNRLVLEWVKVK